MATFWLEVDFNSSKNSRISDRNRIRSPTPTLQLAPEVMGTENSGSLRMASAWAMPPSPEAPNRMTIL